MAGKNNIGIFREKISPFLMQKMHEIELLKGKNSKEFNALYLQYTRLPFEDDESTEANERHWQADLETTGPIHGLERLYRHSIVIEPTMVCAAHCRYCLRANYNIFTLSHEELIETAKFCGSDSVRELVNEILVTGGDPLVVPNRLDVFFKAIIEYAPNIKIIRVGTRLPLHDPSRIDESTFHLFKKYQDNIRFEIATQINHPVDLFPETVYVFKRFREMGLSIYSQNVLLKGINDDIETLAELYDKLRVIGIEAHYLFHCVPMRGMHHYRTSVQKGLQLAKQLMNGGLISGRCKPMFALMTDIGKITLYEGTIIDKDDKRNMLYLQSAYKFQDRLLNNPTWELPKTAHVDENGYLRMWYLDGNDE